VFERSTQLFPGTDRTFQTVFGDLDGDGEQDIFLTDRLAGQHGLWLNQLMETEYSLTRY